jgi:hypothetical protein
MIGRLARGCWGLLACLAVATLLAQAGTIGWLWSRGDLDAAKLQRIARVVRGTEPALAPPPPPVEELPLPEEVEEIRSLAARNQELREQALAAGREQLDFERGAFIAERGRFDLEKLAFEQQLDQASDAALVAGRDNVRQIWETLKPKQAKEQIMLMLEVDEMEEVVRLLAGLPSAKRGKILAEFKTEEEQQKLAEIMRLMRAGVPEMEAIEGAREALTPPPAAPET